MQEESAYIVVTGDDPHRLGTRLVQVASPQSQVQGNHQMDFRDGTAHEAKLVYYEQTNDCYNLCMVCMERRVYMVEERGRCGTEGAGKSTEASAGREEIPTPRQ